MSMAEKLTKIAENVPKVYASGVSYADEAISDVNTNLESVLYGEGEWGVNYGIDDSKIIKKTVSGTYISVDDVSEFPHKVACKVESVNLLRGLSSATRNGITLTVNEDKSVTINGTATATTTFYLQDIVLPEGKYVLSGRNNPGNRQNFYIQANLKVSTGSGQSLLAKDTGYGAGFELSEKSTILTFIGILTGATIDNVTIYPMLNRGTEALPYTPYVKPEEVSVTRCGENWVTFSKAWTGVVSGITTTVKEDGSIVVNGTATSLRQLISNPIPWNAEEDTYCTVSFGEKQTGIQVSLQLVDASGKTITTNYAVATKTVLIPSTCRKIIMNLYVSSGTTVENYTFFPMLNIGTTALPYESYNGQTITPTVDGIVEGFTSVSPYMNIFSDTEGVNIEATYNKSYGMQTEYDRFWDAFQQNGTRENYSHAFRDSWDGVCFNPKYDMVPATAYYMFANCKIENFTDILKKQGVTLDTSKATDVTAMFQEAVKIKELPKIDLSSVQGRKAVQLFNSCTALEKIEEFVTHSAITDYSSVFHWCTALKSINVSGEISADIDFQRSPLNKASITSIINTLSTTVTGQTLTLKLSAVNNALETSAGANDGSTSAEFAALIAPKSNWTITMV